MKSFVFFIVGILAPVFGKNCDHLGTLLYEDLGCTPQYDDSQSCPIKYKCVGLEPSNDKCYFRGKSYEEGKNVENNLSSPSCDIACFCSKYGEKPKFTCASLDCPEWLGVSPKPGCYRTYSLDECCSTGEICPSSDNKKCLVDGTEYREGEKFYPKNTCLKCICDKEFKGKFEEPHCRRASCGVQLRSSSGQNVQNGCSPLYGKKSDGPLCCPSGWICPDGSEKIQGDVKRDDVCKFGDKTLKVGQKFEKTNLTTDYGQKIDKVVCECVIPPLLTCNKA